MRKPKGAPRTRCPLCGGVLTVVRDELVGVQYIPCFSNRYRDDSYWVMEPRPFVACAGCEFCEEIRTDAAV
jgi:hypothetical protein